MTNIFQYSLIIILVIVLIFGLIYIIKDFYNFYQYKQFIKLINNEFLKKSIEKYKLDLYVVERENTNKLFKFNNEIKIGILKSLHVDDFLLNAEICDDIQLYTINISKFNKMFKEVTKERFTGESNGFSINSLLKYINNYGSYYKGSILYYFKINSKK